MSGWCREPGLSVNAAWDHDDRTKAPASFARGGLRALAALLSSQVTNPRPQPRSPSHALTGVTDLPSEVSEAMLEDESFLRAFHHALLEVHLEEGALVCPETGRRFKVSQGIPNLLLQEDEC